LKLISDTQQLERNNNNMSKSSSNTKTKTTYRASTHSRWNRVNPRPAAIDIPISIIVHPVLTFQQLCELRDRVTSEAYKCEDMHKCEHRQDQDQMQMMFMEALNREVNRCKPRPEWMRRPNQPVAQMTQHACIDPAQVKELEGILSPTTLRMTFISITELMNQIQNDLKCKQ
jgi:hypothetical protein